jgi:hypothetical protein
MKDKDIHSGFRYITNFDPISEIWVIVLGAKGKQRNCTMGRFFCCKLSRQYLFAEAMIKEK